MSFVELQQVSRAYGSGEKTFYALDHIDLTMEKGEFVVLCGSTGSGKESHFQKMGWTPPPAAASGSEIRTSLP